MENVPQTTEALAIDLVKEYLSRWSVGGPDEFRRGWYDCRAHVLECIEKAKTMELPKPVVAATEAKPTRSVTAARA